MYCEICVGVFRYMHMGDYRADVVEIWFFFPLPISYVDDIDR